MTDAFWDSRLPSEPEHIAAVTMDVAVQHLKWAETLRNLEEAFAVQEGIMGTGTMEDSRAQGYQFPVVCGGLIRVHQEIHLDLALVNVTQHMCEPGFDSAAVHRPEYVQDADWSHCAVTPD
jgi:hypothetical protein